MKKTLKAKLTMRGEITKRQLIVFLKGKTIEEIKQKAVEEIKKFKKREYFQDRFETLTFEPDATLLVRGNHHPFTWWFGSLEKTFYHMKW